MASINPSIDLQLPKPGPPVMPDPGSPILVVMLQPEDRFIRQKLEVLNWTMTSLAAFVVILRIYRNRGARYKLWWDDYIAMLSLTMLLALSIAFSFEIKQGVGSHVTKLTSTALEKFYLTEQLAATIAIIVISLAKTGFAVTLLKASEGRLRHTILLIIAVVNVVSGASGILIWVQCEPLRKSFELSLSGGCFPSDARVDIQTMNAAVSGAADVALSLFGLYIVHESTRKPGYCVGAMICALMGVFAGTTSFFKAAIMPALVDSDITFDCVPLVVWGIVEPALLIIAASLPELRDYVWKYRKSHKQYSEGSFTHRAHRLTDAEYEFARRQYAAAGSKIFQGPI